MKIRSVFILSEAVDVKENAAYGMIPQADTGTLCALLIGLILWTCRFSMLGKVDSTYDDVQSIQAQKQWSKIWSRQQILLHVMIDRSFFKCASSLFYCIPVYFISGVEDMNFDQNSFS